MNSMEIIKYTAKTLPTVDPMMIRRIIFSFDEKKPWIDGGKIGASECAVEEIGIADKRLDYDEDVIDVSYSAFNISNDILLKRYYHNEVMIFPSRRWRNFRKGENIEGLPSKEDPLIFIGNPLSIYMTSDGGCIIERDKSYLTKTGHELGY